MRDLKFNLVVADRGGGVLICLQSSKAPELSSYTVL